MAVADSHTDRQALFNHTLPFVAWLLALEFMPPGAGSYAVRTALGFFLLLLCRPWRYYEKIRPAHLPLAIAAGAGFFAI